MIFPEDPNAPQLGQPRDEWGRVILPTDRIDTLEAETSAPDFETWVARGIEWLEIFANEGRR